MLCLHDLEMLKQWKWNDSISLDEANYLVPQGYKELKSIAHNFKKYFPNLFENTYSANKFHFRHTNSERTRSSFRAFFDEIFGKMAHKQIDAVSPLHQNDLLLKAYANCKLWVEQKKRLKHSDSELSKFEKSKVFQQMIITIDQRFGFNGTLDAKTVKDIYNLCRYEEAWQTKKSSAWCSVIDCHF